MDAQDIIDIARNDFLYDTQFPYRWSDDFLLRSILEAERQACIRWNLIYDDSSAGIASVSLLDGVGSYELATEITAVESVIVNGNVIAKKSKEELERSIPTWRTDSGIKNKTVYYMIRGRRIHFTPKPSASLDATFIQADAPTSGMVTGDTWWDSANSLLYVYETSAWTLKSNAPLFTASIECYRLPGETSITMGYTPEISEEHHRNLIYWVLHEAYNKRDADGIDGSSYDPQKAFENLSMFNQAFGVPVPADVRQNQLEENPSLTIRPIAYTKRTTTNDDW